MPGELGVSIRLRRPGRLCLPGPSAGAERPQTPFRWLVASTRSQVTGSGAFRPQRVQGGALAAGGAFTLDIAFTTPTPGVTALFGPSGAGKSTLLACLAGLIRPDHADIRLDGEPLHTLPPERRGIGMVFQDGRLFPHLTVRQNLAYGMRRSSRPGMTLDEIASLLGLGTLLGRAPATLSGGERQRVALGRALLAHPKLLLMDEPLASLDHARRQEILPYLRQTVARAKIPVLYVTHARDEVLRLADHLALIDQGRLQAFGTLSQLAANPTLAWSHADEAGGVLLGTIAAHHPERGLSRVHCQGADWLVPQSTAAIGQGARLFIPAREIMLATARPENVSVNNILPARIETIVAEPDRHGALIALDIAGNKLLSRVTQDAVTRLGLHEGAPVFALVKSMSLEVLS